MMKKNFSKALSGILTMALLLSVAVLPGAFHVSAANEFPTVKSEITLTDADAVNEGTLAKYDLLADPSEGLSLEKGDTYVFDMDILANSHHNGGTARPFGFDLLGNPTKSDNGLEIKLAGIEFANKRILRWIPGGAYNVFASSDEFTIWGGGDYHYRFTVTAYESIRVEFWYKNTTAGYQNEAAAVDVTVAWSDIYGLSTVKAGDGTLFYPNMAFLDQNGKISNVAVHYTGTNGVAIKTVKEITLTDEDEANEGTMTKYDLLKDPTAGLTMEEGGTYVFEMNILANSHHNGGTARPFGFDLLGNPTKSDNGLEIKLAGIEFANKRILRWIPGGAYNVFASSDEFTIWGGGDYHYRFTVTAYESIRVEFWYKNTTAGYQNEAAAVDVTVAWSDIYGLSTVKAGDGTLFYPNMAFLDQNGKISNVAVHYTGTNGVAIKTVKEITLTDEDEANEGTMTKYDLLKDPTAGLTMEEGGTYVFEMNILANSHHNGGTARPFGFDLLGNPTKQGGGIKLSGIEFSNKNVLYWIANGAWESYIDQSQTITLWGGGTYHYRFTVKAYESIQVEIWTASTANINSNYPDSTVEYNATVEWSKVYGLSTVKAGDGTRFYPNMTFLDQNGKITNIHAVYIPAAEDEDVVIESFSDISAYRTAGAYTAPTKDGYVFAGWFTDAEATSPVADETTNVYAKFVTQDVLSVKGQLKAGTTAESLNTDYRFSTTVDSLNYQNIGFNITVNGNTKSPSSTTVYKKITARSGNEIIAHDPTVFSAVSQYFHTYTITGIPQSAFATEIQIAAYWTTLDGTVVTGPARTLTVNMGIN